MLVLHSSTDAKNNYLIKEFYHPSVLSNSSFENDFGIWGKDKGLKIFERDMYKRRMDMNGTMLGAYFEVGL